MRGEKLQKSNRPDISLFIAMMGVFFLLFALVPSYWAFYNFGEYRRTTQFLQELRENFDKNPNPEAGQEYSERTVAINSRANRYRLEMFVSGAGALFLFGVSTLFFRKVWQERKAKIFYENINPQTISIPNMPIEIRYKKLYDILFVLFFIFFGAMLLLVVYPYFTSKLVTTEHAVIRSLLFAVPLILTLAIISFLMLRAKRNAVKFIDASGIKRGDGKHFAWTQFCGVITQTARRRYGGFYVWRKELAFAGGETAWIIPQRVKNYREVFDFIDRLPSAMVKK